MKQFTRAREQRSSQGESKARSVLLTCAGTLQLGQQRSSGGIHSGQLHGCQLEPGAPDGVGNLHRVVRPLHDAGAGKVACSTVVKAGASSGCRVRNCQQLCLLSVLTALYSPSLGTRGPPFAAAPMMALANGAPTEIKPLRGLPLTPNRPGVCAGSSVKTAAPPTLRVLLNNGQRLPALAVVHR